MSMRDRFFARTLHATLPLVIWAAHFFASYALVAAECSPAAVSPQAPGRWLLALFWAAALGACLALLRLGWRRMRAAPRATTLLDWAALGSAVLATTGIAWTGLPVLLLEGCA